MNLNTEVVHPDNIPCIEMINTRFKDNAWRGIKGKVVKTTTEREYDEYFIHTTDTVKNWIGWSNSQNRIYWFDGDDETEIGTVDVTSLKFQSVGNVLVIYTKTGDNVKILYSLFDKTTNSYSALVDFEFDILNIQFYKQIQKYQWIFAHRVTVDGVERVNWLALKLVPVTDDTYYFRFVHYKDETETEIRRGSLTAESESARFYPWGIFFCSNGNTVNIIEAYQESGLTSTSTCSIYGMDYDSTLDRYYRTYDSVRYYEQYALGGNFDEVAGNHVPIWDLKEPVFILNDTDTDSVTEPLDVSAGTTTQEKYTIVEGAYNRDKALAQSHGFLEGFIYVTYAFKLFDGNYIKYSFPRLVYIGEETIDLSVFGKIISDQVDLSGFKFQTLGMYIKDSDSSIISNLQTNYSKLIESLDIFISKPVSRFDFTNHDSFVQQGSQIKELSNQVSFYKIFSIPLKDLTKYVYSVQPLNGGTILHGRTLKEERVGTYLWDHYNVYINTFTDLNTIESFEALPVDNYTAHIRYADTIFKYNNRLMIANTIQKLFKGFSPQWLLNVTDSGAYINTLSFEVVIETDEGIKYVRTGTWVTNSPTLTMPQFFGYPDNRAKKFRVLNKKYDSNDTKIVIEVDLTKHLTHNFAYYLSPTLYQQYILELESNNIFELNRVLVLDLDVWDSLVIPTYPTGALDLVEDNNKISITEVNNPFIFPAKFTYQVGNSEIIGLQSNSIPVSQGQFGDYPVVVATKTGFWSLNISETGQVYIANITPLNGLVCTNKESIINIEGTIIFISGEDIIFLAGNDKTIISDQLKGKFESKTKFELTYQQIINNALLFGFGLIVTEYSSSISYIDGDVVIYENKLYRSNTDGHAGDIPGVSTYWDLIINTPLTHVSFTTYLTGAKFGYDRINSEFIVTNPTYRYSYIFSAKYKIWYKIYESWERIIQDYPEFYGQNATSISDLSDESSASTSPVFIETQAIEFSIDGFSKLERLKLEFNASLPAGRYFGAYIFGSIDGEKWGVIKGMELSETISNPIMNRTHISIKYLKLIMSTDVDSIEFRNMVVDYETTLGNKIR